MAGSRRSVHRVASVSFDVAILPALLHSMNSKPLTPTTAAIPADVRQLVVRQLAGALGARVCRAFRRPGPQRVAQPGEALFEFLRGFDRETVNQSRDGTR